MCNAKVYIVQKSHKNRFTLKPYTHSFADPTFVKYAAFSTRLYGKPLRIVTVTTVPLIGVVSTVIVKVTYPVRGNAPPVVTPKLALRAVPGD